ncbi:MAG: DUF2849 domain-containing protein [Novosphingobium sp.]
MKILTGNDLKSGAVTWWDGTDWSLHVEHAVDAGEHGEAIIAREQALQNVTGAYVVDAEKTATGVRPGHIKEQIRATGPTVRLDLSLKPADRDAGNWVI